MNEGQKRMLAGRYRLDAVLGKGGMGRVWRAHDTLLEREVAVKEVLLPPGLGDSERADLCERMLREARASAKLSHPGVVTVHDVTAEDGRPWIVMALVNARSLQDVIISDGPLPAGEVARLGRQMLGALRHAHESGIVHRDVKPANVLLTGAATASESRAVLTDFGIAAMEGDATLTKTGLVMGSPAYIAPERINGERATSQSDLWALGATLFFAVEGTAPYERRDAMSSLAAVLHNDRPELRRAGPLGPVIDGLLQRNAARRMDPGQADVTLAAIATWQNRTTGERPAPHVTPGAPSTVTRSTGPRGPAVPRPGTGSDGFPLAQPDTAAQPSMAAQPGTAAQWAPQAGPPVAPQPVTAGYEELLPPVTDGTWAEPAEPRSGFPRFALFGGLVVLVAVAIIAGGVLLLNSKAGTGAKDSPDAQSTSTSTGANPGNPGSQPNTTPADYETKNDSGFSVAVPKGWKTRQTTSNGVIYEDPSKTYMLHVDTASWSGEPLDHAKTLGSQLASNSSFPSYQQLRVNQVGQFHESNPAAELEFTYNHSSGPAHVQNRLFRANGRTYALYFRAPAAKWAESRTHLDTFYRTFRPS